MSWRDELQPGSFRGVPFLIDRHALQVGRRIALHEYPLRDLPFAEDMGRRARRYSVECLVIGADYMAARDKLTAALEAPGAGTLVHPYLGTRRVVVPDPAEVTESTREGGMARFRISFAESGEALQPAATADTAALVQTQAALTTAQLAQSFGSKFSVAGLAHWLTDTATGELSSFTDKLASLRDSIPGLPDAITGFDGLLSGFSDTLSSLIRTPFDLGASVVTLIVGLGTIAQQPLDALGLYNQLFDFGSDKPASTQTSTPALQQQADNTAALYALVQGTAVAQAAIAAAGVPAQTESQIVVQVASSTTGSSSGAVATASTVVVAGYATSDAAVAVRDSITDALDTLTLLADDLLYPQLIDLRAAVVLDIDTRVSDLPSIVSFTSARTLPALVLAYRLYGDAGRAEEIVARNALAYPGFVIGGQALEVLGV